MEACGPCAVCGKEIERPIAAGRKPRVHRGVCQRERDRLRKAPNGQTNVTILTVAAAANESAARIQAVHDLLAIVGDVLLDEAVGRSPDYLEGFHRLLPHIRILASPDGEGEGR